MNEAVIALLSSLTGLSAAAAGFLWRQQSRNGRPESPIRDLAACVRELTLLVGRQGDAMDIFSRNNVESQKMLAEALHGFGKAQMELFAVLGTVERRLNDVWLKVM